jgi:hypothetical protein
MCCKPVRHGIPFGGQDASDDAVGAEAACNEMRELRHKGRASIVRHARKRAKAREQNGRPPPHFK